MRRKTKILCVGMTQRKIGAASQIRTGDLILTKVADYTQIVRVYGNFLYFG